MQSLPIFPDGVRKQQRATVGGIDMQPRPGGLSESGNLRQRIDRAKVRGPCRGHNSKRKQFLVPHSVERGTQDSPAACGIRRPPQL